MKFLLSFIAILLFTGLSAQSIDKITFKNKADFRTSCEGGKFCATFSVGENPNKTALDNYFNYVTANSTIMSSTQDESLIHLTLNGDKSERIVYQKIFSKLGVFQIEIEEGDLKGIYYVDDFLNLFNI